VKRNVPLAVRIGRARVPEEEIGHAPRHGRCSPQRYFGAVALRPTVVRSRLFGVTAGFGTSYQLVDRPG